MPLLKKTTKGKSLSKKPKAKLRRRPTVEGWARDDVTLVPVSERPEDDRFPKCKDSRMPTADTWYVVDDKGEVESLVTKTANGTMIAWSWCGSCRMPIGTCGCTHGPLVSRGVEFVYDQHRAEKAGQEWTINHKDYKGSYRNKLAASNGRLSATVSSVAKPAVTASKPVTKQQATERPKKSLRKPSGQSAVSGGGVDKQAVQAAAEKTAVSDMQSVERKLASRKPLKKKLKRS